MNNTTKVYGIGDAVRVEVGGHAVGLWLVCGECSTHPDEDEREHIKVTVPTHCRTCGYPSLWWSRHPGR